MSEGNVALKEMTCRELVEVVTEYLEGGMPHEERLRFEQHRRACAHCARYLDQMRAVIGALGRLDEESVSPRAREALLSAFRDWRGG